MPLTQEQVTSFRKDGFILAPGFFSFDEVRAMQAETQRLQREGRFRNVATDGDGKTSSAQLKNLQLIPLYHVSTFFRALPFDGKVVGAISQLIGDPYFLRLDQMFLKPAGDGSGTSWHQDNAYFKIKDPLKGVAMWIAVHDATLDNGTMHLIPGLFDQELPHSRDPMSDHHIRCYPDETKEVPAILAAGGVVFFCYGTPHCTKANCTLSDRAGAAFHFLHGDYELEELKVKNKQGIRPYVTGPMATGGFREYGQTIAHTWPIEVSRVLGG